jgi:hypothetical protein
MQGLPLNPHSHKNQQIITALQETGADTFGMAKLNIYFRILGAIVSIDDATQYRTKLQFVNLLACLK